MGKQQDTAFQVVNKLVVNHPVLKYYDYNAEVTHQCDASERGLGTVLLQNGQPVAFASNTLSPTERRYTQIEKTCLAIVFACQRFSQYLSPDHKPLYNAKNRNNFFFVSSLVRVLVVL